MKPSVVLSGVNFTEMGPLTIFKEGLASLVRDYADRYQIVALVHRKSLFDVPGVTFMEYPQIKSSWWKRLRFEYHDCRALSEMIKPHLWFAMHDITPRVQADVRAVYCHNPAPFYPFSFREALLDWKFGCFTVLYRFLYGINIKSNKFVVVQQDWLRTEFQARYGVRRVVVAHPSIDHRPIQRSGASESHNEPYRFFFPAYPRTFKNMEQILEAARSLEGSGFKPFRTLANDEWFGNTLRGEDEVEVFEPDHGTMAGSSAADRSDAALCRDRLPSVPIQTGNVGHPDYRICGYREANSGG